MPTYAYTCITHGPFDKYVHVDHRDRVRCPHCGVLAKRLIRLAGVIVPDGFRTEPHEYLPDPSNKEACERWEKGVPQGRPRRGY